MTEEKVSVLYNKFEKQVPAEDRDNLLASLRCADDSLFGELSAIKLKSNAGAILLAIFLGSFGADRFYVRSIGAGVVKLIMALGSSVLSTVARMLVLPSFVGLIASAISFAAGLWCFIDIFITYRIGRRLNSSRINDCLRNGEAKRKRAEAANEAAANAEISAEDKPAEIDEAQPAESAQPAASDIADGVMPDREAVKTIVSQYATDVLKIQAPLKTHVYNGEEIGAYVFFYLNLKHIGTNVSCSVGSFYSGKAFASVNLGMANDLARANFLVNIFNEKMPVKAYFSNYNVVIDCRQEYSDANGLRKALNDVLTKIMGCFESVEFSQLARNL